ncbi:MAG: mechanosensitive ion channel [Desulfobacterales bacterium]
MRRLPKNTRYRRPHRMTADWRGRPTRRMRVSGRRRLVMSMKGARTRLRWYRQSSILALAMTGILLIMFAPGDAEIPPENGVQVPGGVQNQPAADTRESTEEAIGTVRQLWESFLVNLPKIIVAIAVLSAAWLIVRLIRAVLRKLLKRWERFNAVAAVTGVIVWLLAVGVVLSILAGDIRALVGSLGLIGLALSWALQTPIESFTGWLLNSFKGYYRVGDRILVGDVFGDVYHIDFLTTTVWEIGDPHRPGFVLAEQPTGRLVTFPNNEVLAGPLFNMTRDFPFVWDEMAVQIANESDLEYAMGVFQNLAENMLKNYMVEPARLYSQILRREGIIDSVPEAPQVFVSMSESWTDLRIRYLVNARERRKWKSMLWAAVHRELRDAKHATRIVPVYTRRQLQFIGPDGKPVETADTS